ncbi:MAG: hypothetical protein WAO02_17000 [Verrucomicrobiia bacterium]
MKSNIVADGLERLEEAQKISFRESIQARYADVLAAANLIQKIKIRRRMRQEFQRQWELRYKPSATALY